MAQLGDVRVEKSLRVKIGEAKNLPPVSYSGSGPKTCCAIRIDSEEIFRTAAVDKSFAPFFNAEFQGEIPKKFRYLSFYLYDVGNKNKVLGKVSLRKEELYKYSQKEHWFPLACQDGDAEVQGKVQVEIRMEEYLPASSTDSLTSLHKIAVRVLECSDLTVINGACNPYAVVSLHSGKGKSREVHRTAVKKKTICPQFDETFFLSYDKIQNQDKSLYEVDDFSLGEISVCLFHVDSKVSREVLGNMFKGCFLGEVRIPLADIDFSKPHRAWYFLQAKESIKTSSPSLGSIRLCINYSDDYVFPSKYYDGLRDLILESPQKKPISSSAAFILGEIVDNRLSAAQPLVKLFLHHGKLALIIEALAEWEIANTKDPNTLFRGNSLLTKIVDELMKYVGLPYLHDTLKGVLDKMLGIYGDGGGERDGVRIDICSENKPCEIDPNRVKEGEDLDLRLANLHDCVNEVLKAILDSSLVCPPVMRDVFAKLKAQAIASYPNHPSVRFHAVTSFVFLRFFTAAILGPKYFDLISDITDPCVQRNLTLISKGISGLVSLVTSQGTSISVKEEYMVPLFDLFRDESTQEKIKMFLEIVSSSSSFPSKSIEAPIILKEGYMIKRAQGRKKFGRKNFKKRFFTLTNQTLSYSTCKGGKVLFDMPITDILAVEQVREESFKMKYMFQVVQAERTLYIQASNCVEEKEWLDTLTKICKSNRNRRTYYHPAAYIHTVNSNHWLCCKSKDQNYVGCTPVTDGLPLTDIKADIDSDREVEKIHLLFLDKMDKLDALQDMCGTQAVYAGDLQQQISPTPTQPQANDQQQQQQQQQIEEPPSCFHTIAEIQKCIITLAQEHVQYMRSVQRHTVIGSIDTPIGDQSSADLVRNMNRSSERLSRHGSRSSNASNLSRRSGRVCRSRGGSFRERDRSRSGTTESGGGGVVKSVSGDVSSTGHLSLVDFGRQSLVKKAASYDAVAAVDRRRRSHGGAMEVDSATTNNDNDDFDDENSSLRVSSAEGLDLPVSSATTHRISRESRGFVPTTVSFTEFPTGTDISLLSVGTASTDFLSSTDDNLDSSCDWLYDSKNDSLATDVGETTGDAEIPRGGGISEREAGGVVDISFSSSSGGGGPASAVVSWTLESPTRDDVVVLPPPLLHSSLNDGRQGGDNSTHAPSCADDNSNVGSMDCCEEGEGFPGSNGNEHVTGLPRLQHLKSLSAGDSGGGTRPEDEEAQLSSADSSRVNVNGDKGTCHGGNGEQILEREGGDGESESKMVDSDTIVPTSPSMDVELDERNSLLLLRDSRHNGDEETDPVKPPSSSDTETTHHLAADGTLITELNHQGSDNDGKFLPRSSSSGSSSNSNHPYPHPSVSDSSALNGLNNHHHHHRLPRLSLPPATALHQTGGSPDCGARPTSGDSPVNDPRVLVPIVTTTTTTTTSSSPSCQHDQSNSNSNKNSNNNNNDTASETSSNSDVVVPAALSPRQSVDIGKSLVKPPDSRDYPPKLGALSSDGIDSSLEDNDVRNCEDVEIML